MLPTQMRSIAGLVVLSAVVTGCGLLNEERPGLEREVRRAVIFGNVRTTAGEAVPNVVVAGHADPEGRCPAEDALYLGTRMFRVEADARGAYRAVVEVEGPVRRGCVRVRVQASTRTTTSTSGGPVRFESVPVDSLRIDVVLTE